MGRSSPAACGGGSACDSSTSKDRAATAGTTGLTNSPITPGRVDSLDTPTRVRVQRNRRLSVDGLILVQTTTNRQYSSSTRTYSISATYKQYNLMNNSKGINTSHAVDVARPFCVNSALLITLLPPPAGLRHNWRRLWRWYTIGTAHAYS